MGIRHSLRFRVLVGSIVLLLLLFGIFSFITLRYYSDRMTRQVILSANRMSDVIRQSTHYSMLLNRRDDVHQIITMIGTEPGVEGIRIYNKRGEIMFSTDKREERSVVNLQTEACYGCHEKEQPLSSLAAGSRTRIYMSTSGHRVLGVINPIRNAPSCSDAGCHAHPPDRTVLGVLDVRLSLETMDATISDAQNTMVLFSVIMVLVVASVSAWYFSTTVLRPVRTLMTGVQEVENGNLDHKIDIRSRDELGRLAQAFNSMTVSLNEEKRQNERWADVLQEKIREKTGELTEIHKQILHVEKMASLGKLAATVAHELNNPLEAILTYAKLIGRRLRRDTGAAEREREMIEDVDLIARETHRCGTIVKNLLLFSKKQVNEFALAPLPGIIEKSRELVRHHCEISNVRFESHFPSSGVTLMCDEGQIQQALVALFVNAVEAMPEGGVLSVDVTAAPGEDEVSIAVRDTGVGVSQHDLPHLFEPFFSTKKGGKGVGLGLSVVYAIVERHGGRINVKSEVGSGTSFIIVLPRVPRREDREPHSEDKTKGVL